MGKSSLSAKEWDDITKDYLSHYRYSLDSKYHDREQIKILGRWVDKNGKNKFVLLTDLFNESHGNADSLEWLVDNGYKVIGIDISITIISRFRKNMELDIPCVVCDVMDLPFKSEEFGHVVSFSTLDHFDKNDLKCSLRDLHRVISPQGRLIATFHNSQNFFLYFYIMKLIHEYSFPIQCYSLRSAASIIESCKFRIHDTEAIVHIFFPQLTGLIFSICEKTRLDILHVLRGKFIDLCDLLGKLKTKYFTCKFVALCAIKR